MLPTRMLPQHEIVEARDITLWKERRKLSSMSMSTTCTLYHPVELNRFCTGDFGELLVAFYSSNTTTTHTRFAFGQPKPPLLSGAIF